MDEKKDFLYELFSLTNENKGMFFTMNIFMEYKKAISNPDTSIVKIASIIEKDPGLTSSALKTANSSFYGFSKNVSTVKQAISILGYKTLERILITQAMKTTFVSENQKFLIDIWKHSLTTAIASQLIVGPKNSIIAEHAFIAGLLHDLGKFILINFSKENMETLFTEVDKNPYQYSINLERDIIGIDHQEVGEFFAKKWLFPENICNTIRHHHNLTEELSDKELIFTVAIANNIAKSMEFGKSTTGLVELLPHFVYETIGFKPDDFENIVQQTKNKFFDMTSLMED